MDRLSQFGTKQILKKYTGLELRNEFVKLLKVYIENKGMLAKELENRGYSDRLRNPNRLSLNINLFGKYSVCGYGIAKNGKKTITLDGFLRNKFSKEVLIQGISVLQDYEDLINVVKGSCPAENILNIRNAELRRIAIEIYGIENYFRDMNPKIINEDETGRLMKINDGFLGITMIEVKDSTTGDTYMLRVPNDVHTAKQAVAWTFGMSEEEYKPVKET